mgnify:CR=1 FL=1
MKKLYFYLNKHMKKIAVIMPCMLVPVAIFPTFGWFMGAAVALLCGIIFVGDYLTNWFEEIKDTIA